MTTRTRIALGIAAATLAGLLGQTFAAVAWFSGSGNRSISGRVTDQNGAAARLCVTAYESGLGPDVNVQPYYSVEPTAVTAADGSYIIRRLTPGAYRLVFRECAVPRRLGSSNTYLAYRNPAPPNFVAEWWNDQPTYETADPIIVPASSDVTGADAVVVRL